PAALRDGRVRRGGVVFHYRQVARGGHAREREGLVVVQDDVARPGGQRHAAGQQVAGVAQRDEAVAGRGVEARGAADAEPAALRDGRVRRGGVVFHYRQVA